MNKFLMILILSINLFSNDFDISDAAIEYQNQITQQRKDKESLKEMEKSKWMFKNKENFTNLKALEQGKKNSLKEMDAKNFVLPVKNEDEFNFNYNKHDSLSFDKNSKKDFFNEENKQFFQNKNNFEFKDKNINEISNFSTDIYKDIDYFNETKERIYFDVSGDIKKLSKKDANAFNIQTMNEDFDFDGQDKNNFIKYLKNKTNINNKILFYGDVNEIITFLLDNNIQFQPNFIFMFLNNENFVKVRNIISSKGLKFKLINKPIYEHLIIYFKDGYFSRNHYYSKLQNENKYNKISDNIMKMNSGK